MNPRALIRQMSIEDPLWGAADQQIRNYCKKMKTPRIVILGHCGHIHSGCLVAVEVHFESKRGYCDNVALPIRYVSGAD